MEVGTAIANKGKKSFRCEICDYSCSQKQDMKTHFESVHEGKKQFRCAICYNTFARKRNMTDHVSRVHEGKKPSLKAANKKDN